jgi:tetratricopeptide (TPR) repeat protein
LRKPLAAERPARLGPKVAGTPSPVDSPYPSTAPQKPPVAPKAVAPTEPAVSSVVKKVPAKDAEVTALDSAAKDLATAEEALALYDHFHAKHVMTPFQEQTFNGGRKSWEDRARQGLIRFGSKWVIAADAQKAHEEATLLYGRAQGLIRVSKFQDAQRPLREASRLDPDSIAAEFTLGILRSITPVKLRDPKAAATHFSAVLHRRPGYVPALNNLAIAEIRQERYADALRHWRVAAERSTDFDEVAQNVVRFINEAKLGRIHPRPAILWEAARLRAKVAHSKEGSPQDVGWRFIPLVSANGERESLDLNYDDHVCSACNGRGRMHCRAPGCQHGVVHRETTVDAPIITGDPRAPVVIHNPISQSITSKCPVCGGTGFVPCPYCGGRVD